MKQTFNLAFSRISELTENFHSSRQAFLESSYSESQARIDFIDKFWIALGWDVNHEREKNPYRQEVRIERNIKITEYGNTRTKKADYAFFAAPNFRDVKFYVEAKKPSRNLDNGDDYFQTIRYGWSSQTPLAVLTDFEQFRVIDCRYKPNISTAINFGLEEVKFEYSDYADETKFRKIYHLFSRESVIDGSLDDYVKNMPKRGRAAKQGKLFPVAIQKSVDESFLDDLDSYRNDLARAFKNKNSELNGDELTEAVTRTLDRLVFIRFLEDKLIEPDTLIDKFTSWRDFVRTCHNLESRYNGVVFKPHFIDSPDFNVDEKVFADVCEEISPQDSSYNFNYIPVHILGSIYERFLGKVIVATDKRAHVEEKPEVRKAGGVYYTPEYIVRYIVENTIGKLIEKKTPAEIAEMNFADIACGSGSFLLGVYDYLLRYHTGYYNETFSAKTRTEERQREARKDGCIQNKDGSFTLSIAQRREILRNNVRHILLSDSKKTGSYEMMLLGKDIQRYFLKWSGTWVNYDPKLKNQIKVSDIKSKSGMTPQTKVDFALRNREIYSPSKIMVRKTADHLIATFDNFGYYFDSLSYGIHLKPDTRESILYILAVLNSRLINFIHEKISQNKEKVFAKVLAVNLGKLPIRAINFNEMGEKAMHDKMVNLVEQMIEAKKNSQSARTDRDKNFYQDRCNALDRQIDKLVYELYELTPDEIKIVEKN